MGMQSGNSLKQIMEQIDRAHLQNELRRLDYGLMDLVLTHQDRLGLRAAGELVAMQRKLRRLRHQLDGKG